MACVLIGVSPHVVSGSLQRDHTSCLGGNCASTCVGTQLKQKLSLDYIEMLWRATISAGPGRQPRDIPRGGIHTPPLSSSPPPPPMFLYANLVAAHSYDRSPLFMNLPLHLLDRELATFIGTMAETDLGKDTVILIKSDHGLQ